MSDSLFYPETYNKEILVKLSIWKMNQNSLSSFHVYRSADKSLARSTSRCILLDGENISFDTSLVIYI